MKNSLLLITLFIFISGCKDDNKTGTTPGDENSIIPAVPFIKDQAAKLDTALYSIIKIEYRDSLPADTVYIRREVFRILASDFLELPDISTEKYKDSYVQSKNFYPDINLISFLTLPKSEKATEIKKQEVLLTPDNEGSRMYKIIIDREWINKDSAISKNLIWAVDDYFQVVTRKQLPGQPETIHTLKVSWTDAPMNK